jgi:hypothetical protein
MEVMSEKYYVMDDQFSVSEYNTLEQALNVPVRRLIVIVQRVKCPITIISNAGSKVEEGLRYAFNFVSEGSKTASQEIKIGKWTARLTTLYNHDFLNNVRAVFEAFPESGEIRKLKDVSGRGFKSIIENYKTLQLLSRYTTWADYDVHVENEALRKEVEVLSERISELQKIIALEK